MGYSLKQPQWCYSLKRAADQKYHRSLKLLMARKLRFLTAFLIEWMKADVLRAQWLCYVSVQSLWVVPKQSGEKKSGLIDTFERYTQSSQASNGIKTLIWAPPITWTLPEVCCFKSSSYYNHLYDIMSMSVACFVALWDYVFKRNHAVYIHISWRVRWLA